jgi:hypothetical protein
MMDVLNSGKWSDHESTKKMLKEANRLWGSHGYKASANGKFHIEDLLPPDKGKLPSKEESPGDSTQQTSVGSQLKKDAQDKDISVMSQLQAEKGTRARRSFKAGLQPPEVIFVSLKDKTRRKDEMQDKAASYIESSHIILVNWDFYIYQSCKAEIIKSRKVDPSEEGLVDQVLHRAISQDLIQAVMGAKALTGSPQWDKGRIKRQLADEGLTTGSMRTAVTIKTRAYQELGSLLTKPGK